MGVLVNAIRFFDEETRYNLHVAPLYFGLFYYSNLRMIPMTTVTRTLNRIMVVMGK